MSPTPATGSRRTASRAAGTLGLLALLSAAVAGADETAWDPKTDEGVPEEQLFKAADEGRTVPGARVVRRPVTPSASVDTAEALPEAAAPEVPELAQPRRRTRAERKAAARAREEAARAPERAPAPSAPGGDEPGGRRIQVFLVPVGEAAGLAAGPAQLGLEAEIGRQPGYRAVDLVAELAVPPAAADATRLRDARRMLSEGVKQIAAHEYDEAANRFRRAVATYEEAGWATDPLEYAEANARLGLALFLSGEEAAAKEALRLCARVDAANGLDPTTIDRRLARVLQSARDDVASGPVGALSVVTAPAGARVFLGGVYRGTTPLTIDRAPAGIQHLRIDRPGAFPVVQYVEAKEGYDTPVRVRLRFTPEALELQKALVQVPKALDRQSGVPDMVKALGKRFRLDRAIIATVMMESTNRAALRMAVFDFPRDVRLADERTVLVVDVEGGLDKAVQAWAATVMDKSEGTRDRTAMDPLSRSDGTEDWYSTSGVRRKTEEAQAGDGDSVYGERSGGGWIPGSTRKKDVTSIDPLDHADGTEDW